MSNIDDIADYLVKKDESLSVAVERLCKNKNKGLVIVENNKPIGVFTRNDMVKCSHCLGMQNVTIDRYYNKNFQFIKENESFEKYNDSIHSLLPIVNDNGDLIDIFFPPKKINCNHYGNQVVINAGGKGTRLYPYTKLIPKPLVPVIDEKPMVELIMNEFYKYGTKEFFMIVNYKKEMIKEYFGENSFPYMVDFFQEETPLDTGGGLYFLKDNVKNTFFFSNCDILMLENCDEIVEFHEKAGNMATMIVSLKPVKIPYGVIQIDENQNIISSLEKPTYMTLVNTGIYVLEPEIFKYINKDEKIGFPDVLKRAKKAGEKVGVYPITADRWIDMGQIDELNHAKELLSSDII